MRFEDMTTRQREYLKAHYATLGVEFVEEKEGCAIFQLTSDVKILPITFGEVLSIDFEENKFRLGMSQSDAQALEWAIESISKS